MSLVSVAEVREQTGTDLPDATVQAIVNGAEAEMVQVLGPHYNGAGITERHHLGSREQVNLYLGRPFSGVVSVTQNGSAVAAASYETQPDLGILARMLDGEPTGLNWYGNVTVVYVPVDDTPQRKQGLIEICRLDLERKAMKREGIAGSYDYSAPDWEAERADILRRLRFVRI